MFQKQNEIKLTYQEIIYALDKLNVQHEDTPNARGYLNVICPMHSDSEYGNCGCDVTTGILHCFNCKNTKHVLQLVKERFNVSYNEAYKIVTNKDINNFNSITNLDYSLSRNNDSKRYKSKSVKSNFHFIDNNLLKPLNPEKYYYTKKRGFTKQFCESFNIKECIEGYYKGYMIIPVIDTEQKIFDFEARKLYQKEKLREKGLTEELLDCLKKEGQLVIKEGNLYSKKYDKVIIDDDLKYLLGKKVLYASGTKLKDTIFNIDNLDFEEDVYISEGSGTVPKVYENISKNITCLFGSELTENQIEILKKFKKRKLIIPDGDRASAKMIEELNMEIGNTYVIDIPSEDTSRTFIEEVKKANIVEAQKYLIAYYKLFDF